MFTLCLCTCLRCASLIHIPYKYIEPKSSSGSGNDGSGDERIASLKKHKPRHKGGNQLMFHEHDYRSYDPLDAVGE